MKIHPAFFAAAAAALFTAGSLRAQEDPVTAPRPTPVASAPTTADPTPISTDPNSMSNAAKPAKDRPLRKAVLEKYDLNKNGALESDEKAAYDRDMPGRRSDKLKKFDKNGDGKLDEQEKVQMRIERLREADAAKKAKAGADKK